MRHERITGHHADAVILDDIEITGEDVYDLPEGERDQFSDDVQRDNFQSVGVDDYAPTDTVIARNGSSYFATRM